MFGSMTWIIPNGKVRTVPGISTRRGRGRGRSAEIDWVTGDHHTANTPSEQRDAGVDDVLAAASTAERSRRLRLLEVERLNVDDTGADQACQARLLATVAPHLRDDGGRSEERATVRDGELDERADPAVVAFEGNERPRVEH